MKKIALFTSALFITLLSIGFASALSFSDLFESFSFTEDIVGENRGFSLTYKTSVPQVNQITTPNCSFVDHSVDGRFKERCLSITDPSYKADKLFSYDAYFDARHRYNADRALDNAFRTFQRDSQQQLKIEQEREKARNRFSYSYFSYRPYYSYGYYW